MTKEEQLKKYLSILSEFEIAKMYGADSESRSLKLLHILLPFIEDEFKRKVEELKKAD